MKLTFYPFVFLFVYPVLVQAQTFSNRNDLLGEKDLHSAVPVAIADMNGDGLDDIVALDRGKTLFIQYQVPDKTRPFTRYEIPVNIAINAQNDIIVADFNNDGAQDIFAIGSYDRAKVFYSIPFTYEFEFTDFFVVPFFSQGATAGDFNGDGWVDVVALNDNGINYSLMNDGTGQLIHEEYFDFVTTPPSDNSGNYGSVYTDFDMDGDSDFYIAKCRQGVNNANDPRRINALFVNDGNNNYVQDASSYGLASGRQTWTTDFGDIDNDGDLDCFMTQHDVISELFENINNDTFINITNQAGLNIGGIPLQGMFNDFDNDGFQDLLVSGDRVDYYRNNGDRTFTKQQSFEGVVFGTFALGDLNHDGFTDVYASRVIPFNNPDLLREDILFLNETNDHHFLSLRLTGEEAEPSAIGATASLYGPWGIQIKEVRAGEQYGVSNSNILIFGLGEATVYDSLIIRWPDGFREKYNQLTIDENWSVRKGGCTLLHTSAWPLLIPLCGSDSLVLKADNFAGPVKWSNGQTGDSVIIKDVGIYFATSLNDDNCNFRTFPVEIIKDPDTIKPVITHEGKLDLCNGESAVLSVPFGLGYQWSSGDSTQQITVTESGQYFVEVLGYCLTLNSDTLTFNFLEPELPVTTNDTFGMGEAAVLTSTGDSIVWYDSSLTEIVGTGAELMIDSLTTSTHFFAQNLSSIPGEQLQLGPVTQQGILKYNAPHINGGLVFEVYETVILNEFTVYTDSVGPRIIEISNSDGFFYAKRVDLEAGATTIQFNIELPVGIYEIGTNTNLNNDEFGENSPYLWRSSDGILYPYEIENTISITGSTFGMGFYYYFYDWIISTTKVHCSSGFVPAIAYLDTEVSTTEPDLEHSSLMVLPNPTTGISEIVSSLGDISKIQVTTIEGIVISPWVQNPEGNTSLTIDLLQFPPGVYLIRFLVEGKLFTRKLIKL